MSDLVVIVGTGTMGAGIAQVAVMHGWEAALQDVDAERVEAAIAGVRTRIDRQVEKGRLTPDDAEAAAARLVHATAEHVARACLLIEAVVEDLDVKRTVLTALLATLPADAIIATNTSSLSVTALGRAIDAPTRTVGMHFFNPAPLMRLVEVIAGDDSDPACVDRVVSIASAWGKNVARAADVPGFIVNNVARPFYLEAFRIVEERYADAATIDAAMRRLGGFRMGPFALTDLIGQDVNTATTRSVWTQLGHPPLLAPSELQERLVNEGSLGRKSGQGVYSYADDPPALHATVAGDPPEIPPAVADAVERFVEGATDERGTPTEHFVFARILAALITQAVLAQERGVATEADIDTALRFGVNYPRGPFAWASEIGWRRVHDLLEALNTTLPDGRFAPPASMTARGADCAAGTK